MGVKIWAGLFILGIGTHALTLQWWHITSDPKWPNTVDTFFWIGVGLLNAAWITTVVMITTNFIKKRRKK